MCKKVLIIDDNADCLEIMDEVLTYAGYEVRTDCGDGDVFNLLDQYTPNIIVIDYILRGINGGEMCSRIKNNSLTCHLPVIIISAYPRVIGSLGYYDCDAFIAKPFDIEHLTNKVNELTGTTGMLK